MVCVNIFMRKKLLASVASHTLVMQIEISVYGVYVRHWACTLKFVFWHMRMRTKVTVKQEFLTSDFARHNCAKRSTP